jgi:hypothetical protein
VQPRRERDEGAVELGEVGILRQLSGRDHLREQDGDARVDRTQRGDQALGRGHDAGHGRLVREVIVAGMEQHDVGRRALEIGGHDVGQKLDIFPAVALVPESGSPRGRARPHKLHAPPRGRELRGEQRAVAGEFMAALGDRIADGHDAHGSRRRVRS